MATASGALSDESRYYKQSTPGTVARFRKNFFRFCRTKPLGAFGLLIIIALLIVAAFPGVFAKTSYDEIDILGRLKGPSADNFFGSDNQGRDVYSRIVYGARTSVFIGFGAVALSTVFSTLIGLVTGYFGGLVDLVSQRIVEIMMAFPGIIFIIFLVSIFGPGIRTVIITLGVLFTAGSSRVIRSTVISVKANQFVEAAKSTGASDTRLMFRHILPNIVPIILINISIQIGAVILIESSLSFLGYGVPPPYPSWGRMLQDGQIDMAQHPYLAFFPGAAIALTIYSFNMLGDALRDVLDPRLRGSR